MSNPKKPKRSNEALFDMTQTKTMLKKMSDDELLYMRTYLFKLAESCTVEYLRRATEIHDRLDKEMVKQ